MTALTVSDLVVRHGAIVAVDSVGFDVPDGAIVGLIGPNGAGKSSVIDAVTGFERPAAGEVTVFGRRCTGIAPHDAPTLGLARTFQSIELFADLTVRENVAVAAGRRRWWSLAADLVVPTRAHRDTDAAVDAVLAELDLAEVADRSPDELSNGQRHVVALARALVAKPRLLLLDEPAAGLDPTETAALAATITGLRDRGITILLVDHDMDLVLRISDEVLVLDGGRLIATGTPDEVRRDPAVLAAYLGTADPS